MGNQSYFEMAVKKNIILFLCISFLFMPFLAEAAVIVLKSGKTVEGRIIEESDRYVKIDFYGVTLTYFKDEIKEIKKDSGQVTASPSAVDKTVTTEQVKRLLELSDSDNLGQQIIDSGKVRILQEKKKRSPEVSAIMEQAVNAVSGDAEVEKLNELFADYVRSHLSSPDINTALSWFNSPVGGKVRLAELASRTAPIADKGQQIKEIALQLQADTYPSQRLALARELEQATNSTDMLIHIMSGVAKAEVMSFYELMSPEQKSKLKPEDADKELNTAFAQFRPSIQLNMIANFLYTYRSLSDSDLKDYIDFSKTTVGKNMTKVFSGGLEIIMNRFAVDLMQEVTRLAPKLLEKKPDVQQAVRR